MALTNTLKQKVDLPVWEWMRPCPIATAAGGTLTTADDGAHRYLYYLGATFYRYDTISDSWNQLTTPPVANSGIASIKYTGYRGYYGRAISAPSANTLRIAGLYGKALSGYRIRIISGTGAGQERTITDVADPIIWERGVVTAVSTTTPLSLSDSTKTWAFNRYRDYQVRIVLGTGVATRQTFKIQYNSNNTVYVADGNYQGLEPFVGAWYRAWTTSPVTTGGSQTIFQIESNDITVNSNWDILPNNTSRFVVLSGGIWALTGGTNFVLMYYDILSDAWYSKTSQGATGIGPSAALATDVVLEKLGEYAGAFWSGSATSGSLRNLTDATLNLSENQYVNYRVRITSGSGWGQERTIISSSVNTLTVAPPFSISPLSSSQYKIYGDTDKLLWTGDGKASLYKYSAEADIHVQSDILDYGCPAQYCFTWAGMPTAAQPISSITRVGTLAQVTTSYNHCLSASNVVQIYGASDPLYNISASVTSVPTLTGFTYVMAGTPGSNATTAIPALSINNLSDPSKNWITNEHSGSICIYQSATVGTYNPVFRAFRIQNNTSQSLTLFSSSAAPIIGGKYAICSQQAFGTYYSASVPVMGSATTLGSTTTIVDSTKTWPVNIFAGYRVKVMAGAGHGSEVAITSNTATTLTVGTLLAASDTSSMYCVLGSPVKGLSHGLLWAGSTSGSLYSGYEKYLYSPVGGASSQLTRFNLQTDQWELIEWYPFMETLTTGTCYAYDGTNDIYFQKDNTGRIYRLDVATLVVEPAATIPYGHSTVLLGNRMEIIQTEDDLKYLYIMRNTGQEMWRTLLFW